MAWQEQGKQPMKDDAVGEVHTAGYKPLSMSVLIIGGIGSGKSTIGNTLLGHNAFRVGSNLLSCTRKAELQVCDQQQWMGHLKVLYTPSLPHIVSRMEENVALWKETIGPFPDVILLVIKRDRYSLDEYKAYEAMKEAWGQDDFCQRLVVVFTHCGNRTPDLGDLWPSLPPKVQGILRDAEFRVVSFEEDQLPAQREALLRSVMRHLWLIREAEGDLMEEIKNHRDDIFKLFGQLDEDKNKDIREFLKEKNQARQKEVQDVLDSLSKERMNKQKKQDGNGPHTKHLGIVVFGVVIAILLVGILFIIYLCEDANEKDLPPLSEHPNENQTHNA